MALSSLLRHRCDPIMQIYALFATIALDNFPLDHGSLVSGTVVDLYSTVHREALTSITSDRRHSDCAHCTVFRLAHRWVSLGRRQSISMGELRLWDLFDQTRLAGIRRPNSHRPTRPFIHPSVSLQFHAGHLHLLQDLSTTSTPGDEIAHGAGQRQTEEETSTVEEVSRPWDHLDASLSIAVVTLHLLSQSFVLLPHLVQTHQRSWSR